ncbi:hypothetical protein [Spiroplasma endosymbiont of Cantharis nigra]|uniref:hypothetical protein n=1 Tax=Spiroplasma endosymbiont of Cantharis nigra TaxID=3066278 RepID=UPI0030CB9A58
MKNSIDIKYFNYSNENINSYLKKINNAFKEINLIKNIKNIYFKGFSDFKYRKLQKNVKQFDVIKYFQNYNKNSRYILDLICIFFESYQNLNLLKSGIIQIFYDTFSQSVQSIYEDLKLVFNNLKLFQNMLESYFSKILNFLLCLKLKIENSIFEINRLSGSFSLKNKYSKNKENFLLFSIFVNIIRDKKIFKFNLNNEIRNYYPAYFNQIRKKIDSYDEWIDELFLIDNNFLLFKIKIKIDNNSNIYCVDNLYDIFEYLEDFLPESKIILF